MAFKFLAEGIGQTREAAVVHPHGEIRAFNIGCRNVLGIRFTRSAMLLSANAFGWAILALGTIGC